MKRALLTGLVVAVSACGLQGCGLVEVPVLLAAGAGGAGVMMAQDRRTSSAYLGDQNIENKSNAAIDAVFKDNRTHVNVTSFNGNVLISGEAATAADRLEVARIVAGIDGVRLVYNQLVVGLPTSLSSRSNDTMITSDVKLGMTRVKDFHSDYVKVVTENGTVFLMGMVQHAEATIAADVASTSNGVQRVVKLFEYID